MPRALPTFNARLSWFLLALAISASLFVSPLAALLRLSLADERYSCAGLAPLLAAGLIAMRRRWIFALPRSCPGPGLLLIALGIAVAWPLVTPPDAGNALALRITGLLLCWSGAFLLFFGLTAARRAMFPLGVLFLAVPIPLHYLIYWVHFLQHRSADAAALLFPLVGIPALRDGVVFSLPGFEIEIAEQCSGIRSGTALVLAASLAAYLFLRTSAGRLLFVAVTVPVVILRNALRIVTLSALAVYVSHGFLFGRLHHFGGLLFSLLDVVILTPLLLLLRRAEERPRVPGRLRASQEDAKAPAASRAATGPSTPFLPERLP